MRHKIRRILLVSTFCDALPWEFDPAAEALIAQGLQPVMRRFQGFLPESTDPFDVSVVEVSGDADLAVLRCSAVTGRVAAVSFNPATPAASVSIPSDVDYRAAVPHNAG